MKQISIFLSSTISIFYKSIYIFILALLMASSLNAASSTGEIIVDNLGTRFSITGTWAESIANDEYAGSSLYSKTLNSSATWTPSLTNAGSYEVYVWYSGSRYGNRGMAQYSVNHNGDPETIIVDQNEGSGTWVSLGVFEFDAGNSGNVTLLCDFDGGESVVIADAVKFVAVDNTTSDFRDTFNSDSILDYNIVTWGTGADFVYDSEGLRAEVQTGNDNGLKFDHTVPASSEGSFSIDFMPTMKYSRGALLVRLEQDENTYYQIKNTDGEGSGKVSKYVNGVEVASALFRNGYVQDTNYKISVTFSPSETTVKAFGNVVVMQDDTTPISVNSFSVKTWQQDAYFDNIMYDKSKPVSTKEIIVDNLGTGFSTTGTWAESIANDEYAGSSLYSRTLNSSATWTPALPDAGLYEVYVWYSGSIHGNRDTQAQYTVNYSGGSQTVSINQNQGSGAWVSLGVFKFDAGNSSNVTLLCGLDGGESVVIADAVKFVPVDNVSVDFIDTFDTDTTSKYEITTWGTGASFTHDSEGSRASVHTGANAGLKFSHTVPASSEGSFSINVMPTVKYSSGALLIRLEQDKNTYYQIKNTDGEGAGKVSKYVNGVEVSSATFNSEYSTSSHEYRQGVNYTISVTFSPSHLTVKAFGQSIILEDDTVPITVNSFSVKTWQQDVYIDTIKYIYKDLGIKWQKEVNLAVAQSDDFKTVLDNNGDINVIWPEMVVNDFGDFTESSIIFSRKHNSISGQWEPVEELNYDSFRDAYLAVGATGDVVAIWSEYHNGSYNIKVKRYDYSTGLWGEEEEIWTEIDPISNIHFTVDSKHNITLIWNQEDISIAHDLMTKRYDATNGQWGPEETLSYNIRSTDVHMALDGNDNVILLWENANHDIVTMRYSSVMQTWGTEEALESYSGGSFDPQIARDENGNIIAVWWQRSDDNTADLIIIRRYDTSTGQWQNEKVISDTVGYKDSPQIVIDANGNAIVSWMQYYFGTYGPRTIRTSYYDHMADQWSASEEIGNSIWEIDEHKIVFDSSGNAIAIWHLNDGSLMTNYYSHEHAKWRIEEVLVESNWDANEVGPLSNSPWIRPHVEIYSKGNALVIWKYDDSPYSSNPIYDNTISSRFGIAR